MLFRGFYTYLSLLFKFWTMKDRKIELPRDRKGGRGVVGAFG